jgi:hypothetical protein
MGVTAPTTKPGVHCSAKESADDLVRAYAMHNSAISSRMTDDETRDQCDQRGIGPQQLLPREPVMGVPCPHCLANRDENCTGGRGSRTRNHIERVFSALRAFHSFA